MGMSKPCPFPSFSANIRWRKLPPCTISELFSLFQVISSVTKAKSKGSASQSVSHDDPESFYLAENVNINFLKCLWSKKKMLLIWKAFQSKEEWRFLYWNIFITVRDIYVFVLCKWGKKNIGAVFLKLGTRTVHHKISKMTPVVLLPWQQLCRWFCIN